MSEFNEGLPGAVKRLITSSSISLAIIYTAGHIAIAMTVVSVMTGASLWEAGAFALIEPSINGIWLVIKKQNKLAGVIPNYRKFNSNGEYVFDHIFVNAYNQLGLQYFPKYLSATPFTPVKRKNFFYSDRKIDLNEQLSMTNSTVRFKEIEEELYEINDTIKKLTANMEPEMEWYGS